MDYVCKTTAGRWRPYRGSFTDDGSTVYVAVTAVGGFSGFGDTPSEAEDMARARLLLARQRAIKDGMTEAQWLASVSGREERIERWMGHGHDADVIQVP